jgi:hypothetical protein
MDIQAHRSNTVKVHIPHGHIREAIKDVRKWRIKHLPFRRVYGGLEMELYPNSKITFLLLKYTVDKPAKDAIL